MKNLYHLRTVRERVKDNKEIFIPPNERAVIEETNTCHICPMPYCTYTCPLGSDIDIWIGLMQKKRYREAFEILHKTNPFPEFTGRLCHSPCEPACVNAISDYPTSIKELEKYLADMALKNNWIIPSPPKSRTNYNIAIVGSGPAGLSAANTLNKMGHNVIVYERDEDLGGMLRYAIPEFRLPKILIDFRVEVLKEEGVSFVTGKHIGVDIKAKELLNNNDILLLSTGATVRRQPPIMGSDLKGVVQVLDFLKCYNKKSSGLKLSKADEELLDLEGKEVIVISDKVDGWIGAVTRLNIKNLSIFSILPMGRKAPKNNPSWPKPYLSLHTGHYHREGCKRFFCISVKKFCGDSNGTLSGLVTAEVEWKVIPDQRPILMEIPGTEKHWCCDLVILSLGLTGSETTIADEIGLEFDNRTNIKTSKTYRTNIENVFACGDARSKKISMWDDKKSGQSEVSIAMEDGIEAAKEINTFLLNNYRKR